LWTRDKLSSIEKCGLLRNPENAIRFRKWLCEKDQERREFNDLLEKG